MSREADGASSNGGAPPIGAARAAAASPPPPPPTARRPPPARHTPPLRSRLAVAYYCWSFAYWTWIWLTVSHCPAEFLPTPPGPRAHAAPPAQALALCALFPPLLPALAAYTLYILSPRGWAPVEAGAWPTPFRRWALWRWVAEYFRHSALHKTADLAPRQPYILAVHPHGVLAFGTWLAFATEALGFGEKFPGVEARVTTLDVNFKAPFLREYLLLHGVASCARGALEAMLHARRAVVLVVGGGAESLLSRPGAYDLVLRRRRGFVRVALRTGALLVPVVTFGETETYRTITELPHNSAVRRFQRLLLHLTGFTLPLAFGRGLLTRHGLLPFPAALDVVVGAPVPPPSAAAAAVAAGTGGAAFEAAVDAYHARYVAALEALFAAHAEKFAPGAELRILE
jgi:hypothetical protein